MSDKDVPKESQAGNVPDTKSPDGQVILCVTNFRNEADTAKRDRSLQNLENFDTYNLKEDFTYKKKGQSKEFMPKVFMAVEQITSFVQQGLADLGDEWYSLENEPGVEQPIIKPEFIKKILDRQLKKADFYGAVGDALKHGLLASLMIFKIHTKWVNKPQFRAERKKEAGGKQTVQLLRYKDKVCQLSIEVVSQKDWFPDPTGRGLYLIHECEMDLHEIESMVKSDKNPKGIYDAAAVAMLSGDNVDMMKDAIGSRESGQNVTMSSYRHRVQIQECWGTILDANGRVLHENVVCTVAKGRFLIQKPTPISELFWHNRPPFVVAPIVRVPHSVWHKALMDAPTKLNRAINELYNLSIDSACSAVFGVRQLRTDWLSDPTCVDDGITPGMTLETNSQCPPGAKVMERVDTGVELTSGVQMLNMLNSEHQQATMTNDLRMGILPPRQVKATEVVESSQSITGMLNGVCKALEVGAIDGVLELAWMTVIQHVDDFDSAELRKILGPQVADQIAKMTPEERFAETVNGIAFKVFGISNVLNKQKDFRRIVALLQTIAGDPVLMEQFAQHYDFGKLLKEIMKTLDINEDKIRLDKETGPLPSPAAPVPQAPEGSQSQTNPGQLPNNQSQIMQVASQAAGPISTPKFPPSRATQVLHG